MIIEVILRNKIQNSNRLSYYSPHSITIGCRVEVTLNQKEMVGFVVSCREDEVTPYKLHPINRVIDETPVLSSTFLALFNFLNEITYSNEYDVLSQCLPIHKRLKLTTIEPIKKKRYVRTHVNVKLTTKTTVLTNYNAGDEINLEHVTPAIKRSWIQKEYIKEINEIIAVPVNHNAWLPPLNHEQKKIVDSIDLYQFGVHVIKGPTGSGKTHVFMACAQKILHQQQRVLICVPEISLTPHMVARFKACFNVPVLAYHSTLSDKEKATLLAHVHIHQACIVIATRSGLFIDESFGLIVIDEEHDSSFYQTSGVVYHAHDVALFLAQHANIPLLLASATLSLETYAKALKGLYHLHSLTSRHEASMPTLHVVNMREDIKRHHSYMISTPLIQAISSRLALHQQVLILINRRGAFPTLTCDQCLNNAKCPECGLHLNYHSDTQQIHCHYCSRVFLNYQCMHCKHTSFTGSGYGTQSVVARLKVLFPTACIERLDSDVMNTSQKEAILHRFEKHDINILVGTSLISKGLDIENVTCVGILDADYSLSFLNLRSAESTFAMLMQASGRSGRATKQGEVYVQVMDEQHRVIQCLKNQDYDRFFKEEMTFRRLNQLPPYVYLISIEIAHKTSQKAFEHALVLTAQLREAMQVIGPSSLLKQRGLFRYQIIIKTKDWKATLKYLKKKNIRQSECDVHVFVNPYALGGL